MSEKNKIEEMKFEDFINLPLAYNRTEEYKIGGKYRVKDDDKKAGDIAIYFLIEDANVPQDIPTIRLTVKMCKLI